MFRISFSSLLPACLLACHKSFALFHASSLLRTAGTLRRVLTHAAPSPPEPLTLPSPPSTRSPRPPPIRYPTLPVLFAGPVCTAAHAAVLALHPPPFSGSISRHLPAGLGCTLPRRRPAPRNAPCATPRRRAPHTPVRVRAQSICNRCRGRRRARAGNGGRRGARAERRRLGGGERPSSVGGCSSCRLTDGEVRRRRVRSGVLQQLPIRIECRGGMNEGGRSERAGMA